MPNHPFKGLFLPTSLLDGVYSCTTSEKPWSCQFYTVPFIHLLHSCIRNFQHSHAKERILRRKNAMWRINGKDIKSSVWELLFQQRKKNKIHCNAEAGEKEHGRLPAVVVTTSAPCKQEDQMPVERTASCSSSSYGQWEREEWLWIG